MKSLKLIAVTLVLGGCAAIWTGYGALRAQNTAPANEPRSLVVGTYDPRALAVAFSPTPQNAAEIADLQRQLKAAQDAGDTARAEQIKARGMNLQTVAHLQAFSGASVENVLTYLAPRLDVIAKEAGVDVIVAKVDFQAPNVTVIDITDKLVAEFKPSARTLQTITELRKQKPLPMVDVVGMKN